MVSGMSTKFNNKYNQDRVIIIEANPGEAPKFSYAEILKQKVKEIEFDPKV